MASSQVWSIDRIDVKDDDDSESCVNLSGMQGKASSYCPLTIQHRHGLNNNAPFLPQRSMNMNASIYAGIWLAFPSSQSGSRALLRLSWHLRHYSLSLSSLSLSSLFLSLLWSDLRKSNLSASTEIGRKLPQGFIETKKTIFEETFLPIELKKRCT